MAHCEIDPDGVVMPSDPFSDVIQKSTNWGLFQSQGRWQAAAHQSRPHLSDTVPVSRTRQADTTVHTQQTVQSTLSNKDRDVDSYRLLLKRRMKTACLVRFSATLWLLCKLQLKILVFILTCGKYRVVSWRKDGHANLLCSRNKWLESGLNFYNVRCIYTGFLCSFLSFVYFPVQIL